MQQSISYQIDCIIAERKKRLPTITSQIDKVKAAQKAAQHIIAVRSSIINEQGKLNSDSQFYPLFAENPDMLAGLQMFSIDQFISDSNALLEKYNELKVRFSRDYINIAAVGTARQGKSQFLKSVSGLDDRCIPAFIGDHCTGASSTIQNSDSNHVLAEITFKTELEIVSEVQGYLDAITNRQYRITSFRDIPAIDEQRVRQLAKEIEIEKQPLAFSQMEKLFDRFVHHFSEWSGYIGQPIMSSSDENIIMQFVAQHNGHTDPQQSKRFYQFVAVKKALIKKKFVFEDAGKIRMIDTEGLGATTTDTESNMMTTIKNDSDAVIFFKRPEAGFLGTPTADECKVFGRIREQFEHRKMDKWFAFLVNHTTEIPEAGIHENGKQCKEYFHFIENNSNASIPTMMNAIIDVSDRNSVINDLLVPFLNGLAFNLSELDNLYFQETIPLAERTFADFEVICGTLNSIAKQRFSTQNQIFYSMGLIRNTYETQLITAVRNLNLELGKKRFEPCYILVDKIDAIISDIMKMIPSEEEIDQVYATHGGMQPVDIYAEFLDKIRNKLTQRFIQVDTSLEEIVRNFKNNITECLTNEAGGRLAKVIDFSEDSQPYLALLRFADKKMPDEEYPQVKSAIEFICRFDFSVRGFLMNKLRANLYEISRANPNLFNGLNFISRNDAWGHSIRFHLKVVMKGIQNMLKNEFRSFYQAPNEALFAACDEFYDRIYYAEGVRDEWNKLYSEYIMQIWGKELMAHTQNGKIAELWLENINRLQSMNKIGTFVLKTGG